MKDVNFYIRGEKIPESFFYFGPRLFYRLGPSAERRFHTYQNVLNGTPWFRICEKHVAVVLRERLHPFFKRSVRPLKIFIEEGEGDLAPACTIRIVAAIASAGRGGCQATLRPPPRLGTVQMVTC